MNTLNFKNEIIEIMERFKIIYINKNNKNYLSNKKEIDLIYSNYINFITFLESEETNDLKDRFSKYSINRELGTKIIHPISIIIDKNILENTYLKEYFLMLIDLRDKYKETTLEEDEELKIKKVKLENRKKELENRKKELEKEIDYINDLFNDLRENIANQLLNCSNSLEPDEYTGIEEAIKTMKEKTERKKILLESINRIELQKIFNKINEENK